MNWDCIEDNWKEYSDKAKIRWRKLPDDQISQVNGDHDQFCRLIQDAYGLERGEAEQQVKDWRSWL